MDLTLSLVLVATLSGEPSLSDLSRFPSYEVAVSSRDFCQACKKQVERRLTVDLPNFYDLLNQAQRIDDTTYAWNLLVQARGSNGTAFEEYRTNRLKELRVRIGKQAYDAGVMPEPIQLWECQDLTDSTEPFDCWFTSILSSIQSRIY